MPNWVDCDFVVEGSKDELQKFKKFAKEGKDLLSANKFIPYPKKYKKLDDMAEKAEKEHKPRPKDGFNSGGYEWCIKNWGTKWGIVDAELLEESGDRLTYAFITAWSTPTPLVEKMSEMFPKLTFELSYYEASMEFSGKLEVKGGIITKDEYDSKYNGYRGG